MLLKLYNVYKNESWLGLIKRIKKKFWLLKLNFYKFFKLEYVNSYYDIKFKSNYNDTTFKFYVIGWYGDKYFNHLKKINYPFLYLDIGSNQGLYSILSARNIFCEKCYSFEPVKKTFNLLKKNVFLNNLSHKFHLVNKAISNTKGVCNIKIINNHSGAATIKKDKSEDNANYSIETIETITADQLNTLIDNKKKLSIIIKIDVEGHEEIVITELMKSKFKNEIQEIFFEVNEDWIDYAKLKKILESHGFVNFTKYCLNHNKYYDILAQKH